MLTCTWAPTVFAGMQLHGSHEPPRAPPRGAALDAIVTGYAKKLEASGLSHLLIAQRWWGSGQEMEASSLDCLAMTTLFAARTTRLQLVTAIHPGFFSPTAIAKWGATMDLITGGRWSINVTSGWNLREFSMYGVDALDHDARYARAAEFIDVLRGAWTNETFDYRGQYYQADGLQLQPRPGVPLTVFQGGQSDAAIELAAGHSDWMFLNGGALDRIAGIVGRARAAAERKGRTVRFAMHAQPLCRATDAQAWQVIEHLIATLDPAMVARRRQALAGAQGMWSTDDDLSMLDTNEGYAARLIGSPATVLQRIREYEAAGIDMLHLTLGDELFAAQVLPRICS